MHPAQSCVVERLNSQRHSIDACLLPRAHDFRRDVLRIRLERDLCALVDEYAFANLIEQPTHAVAAELGGRAATEVQGFELKLRLAVPRHPLAVDREQILFNRHLRPYRNREIAVHAATRTERDVNVEMLGPHTERYGRNFLATSYLTCHGALDRAISSLVMAARHSAAGSPLRWHNESRSRAP